MSQLLFVLLGLVAGVFGGMMGLGGGIIIIPALVYLFGFSQHQAQGTSLLIMVPPITLLAAWQYYSKGHVRLDVAGFICLGFLVGGLIGANFAQGISGPMLKKIFGGVLFLVSMRMILSK
jgi:uncharacterized membrane protein YfcA